MNDRSPHDRFTYAMHCVEERQSIAERSQVVMELIKLGWHGGSVWPVYMQMILEKVSPMLVDEEFRKQNIRGFGEDVH